MTITEAKSIAENLIFTHTGDRLSDLQSKILELAWHGQKYATIAESFGYTEGHVKDVGAQLWKLLSELLNEKVTKSNFQIVIERANPITNIPNESISRDFVGREQAIARLQFLRSGGAKIVVIQAQGGVGKTTLARRYLIQEFGGYLEFAIAKETQNTTSVESLVEERLRQLNEEPGREFGISLDRLKRKLQSTPMGILIDNLEPVLDAQGKFIPIHRRYVELLQSLSDPSLQSLTLITSRDRLSESALNVSHYLLPSLQVEAWQDFFGDVMEDSGETLEILKDIHKAYGGNAKAMQIIKSAIALDFDGDIRLYWQEYSQDPLVHSDLADLVITQFDRLQQLDPKAYKLLCRMGCYRYQDVPTVTISALLNLLWDVPSERHRVIKSLQNRSLVEHHHHSYWLHPSIRVHAIALLRAGEEIELTNRTAAEFWTNSIDAISTVNDALTAFEAYYHYIEIEDYEKAAHVILQRRSTKLAGVERLGRSFYQLGLLQQMMPAISQIIPKISSGYYLSGLYSILGVLYRLSGQIHTALDYHHKSGAIAVKQISSMSSIDRNTDNLTFINLKNWEQHALLNTGICQIELWELEKALTVFKQLLTSKRAALIEDNLENLYNPSVDILAAFLYSSLEGKGNKIKADRLAERFILATQQHPQLITGHRLLYLGLTYKNLKDPIAAQRFLNRAIAYAEEHNYTQVRANALSGLAEIYRSQQDFTKAIAHHLQAVELLEQIGTKCNLAEAHFQFGLTLQVSQIKEINRQIQQSDIERGNFDRAIQLFTEMSAPKQVEKVKTAKLISI